MTVGGARPVHGLDEERAHLVDPTDRTVTLERTTVAPHLSELAQRFWIPVWHVPAGTTSTQSVLQYPVCQLVVSDAYARLYGVVPGLSQQVLEGRGWAVGLMLRPSAGWLLTRRPMSRLTGSWVDLDTVGTLDGCSLATAVRRVMAPDPHDLDRQAAARTAVEEALVPLLPVDDEGRHVNAVVDTVEGDPGLLRVDDLCRRFDLRERTLQRLLGKRLGLGPKWLIRRRRLQEAAHRLRDDSAGLAVIAADLGYADQAHFTRDFRLATGLTPGEFAARFR